MRNWLQHGFESLINVFWQPTAFFETSDDATWLPVSHNAFYAAIIHAVIGVFLTIYFDVLSVGWQGLLFTMPRVGIRPVVAVLSILAWSGIVYATLWCFDEGDLRTTLSVIAYSWLVSIPYTVVEGIRYLVEEILRSAGGLSGMLQSGLVIGSSVLSAASIIHITIASVIGLHERIGAKWWHGIIATVVVPFAILAAVLGLVYLI